ncbi:HAD hydrolase-like protein [Streptococcus sp. zg-JUN1979]|uniref:HAD hydrolase-like protein n=1 Tax=Streptococcus sp. zg-JUN1979 TaxID=3391450 RepID=UPI0039A7127F
MAYLLFDLDGTLVNSSTGIKNAFYHSFTELGLTHPNDKTLSTFIGPPLETTFAHYFDNKEAITHAISIFRDYYETQGVYQAKLYQDIPETLEALSQEHRLFVTTSKHQPMAHKMLSDLDIDKYFTAIYGSLPERYLKTDVIKVCLNNHHIPHDEAAIIGDTRFDMIGGRETNITCVGVTWGFGSADDLKKSGADTLIHHPKELLSLSI